MRESCTTDVIVRVPFRALAWIAYFGTLYLLITYINAIVAAPLTVIYILGDIIAYIYASWPERKLIGNWPGSGYVSLLMFGRDR